MILKHLRHHETREYSRSPRNKCNVRILDTKDERPVVSASARLEPSTMRHMMQLAGSGGLGRAEGGGASPAASARKRRAMTQLSASK